MCLDRQGQRLIMGWQSCRQQWRERNVALAEGNEAPRHIAVILTMNNVREREQSGKSGCRWRHTTTALRVGDIWQCPEAGMLTGPHQRFEIGEAGDVADTLVFDV